MKIVSIIPARGGSKGIPMKNLRVLNGKPLLDYSVNASINSKLIDMTIVSSDNQRILHRAKRLGVRTIKRPKKISTDAASIEDVIMHCLQQIKKENNYTPDVIILLQNTVPLRTTKHIDDAIRFFVKRRYDSVLSGFNSHQFFWKREKNRAIPINYNPRRRPNRQQFKDQFIENGAIYITKYSSFIKTKCRVSGRIGLYEMPSEMSIDIDIESDLTKANQIMRKNNKIT
jgi:N-acylneuraminate cytidylyltransferase